jgi:hypothetical protein
MDFATLMGEVFKYGLAPFLGAAGAYMAIREDLAVLRTKVAAHEKEIDDARKAADKAHERINSLIERK